MLLLMLEPDPKEDDDEFKPVPFGAFAIIAALFWSVVLFYLYTSKGPYENRQMGVHRSERSTEQLQRQNTTSINGSSK